MTVIGCAPWPSFSEQEGDLIKEILLSNRVNYWTGQHGMLFEKEFAASMDSNFSIALANGTVALDLALKTLGIGVGDEVIVTPRSFMASASAIHNSGATPVFADVDPDSQNITCESISEVLTKKSRAIVCVHLAGWPCEMTPIKELAEQKNLVIIEDCAQAHGARYRGESVGGIGDIGAWSFCQDKIMSAGGEGGMVTTNNEVLFEKMWAYKDHGKNRSKMLNPPANKRFKYVHDSFGTNFRLTEMQSALGVHQLQLLEDWTKQRTRNAMIYNSALASIDAGRTCMPPEHLQHAYYKYYFFLNLKQLSDGWSRDRVVEEINEAGGYCLSGSCPEMYREEAFVRVYGEHARLKNAYQLGQESLMLMCHPGLSEEFLCENLGIIEDILKRATS